MKISTLSRVRIGFLCACLIVLVAAFGAYPTSALLQSQRNIPPATGYITGVVQSSNGTEAGVWVIAETKDLLTNFIKEVVTDDQGKFMVPDLPNATYKVWVRGYGLLDSTPVTMKPGTNSITLRATVAKTPQEAAKVYPGNYWLSLLAPPDRSMFPGKGNQGNGIGAGMLTQNHWINQLKSGCNFCHQLGNQLTRTLDDVYKVEPNIKTSVDAWDRRLHGGVRGDSMYGTLSTMGHDGSLKSFADWTDRIAKGEVPPAPKRPKGVERNVVVTLWDVGDDHSFMHDQASTDKNHPTVNGGGPVYAVNAGHGQLVVMDPKENSTYTIDIPTREDRASVPSRFPKPVMPSLHWGNEWLWANPPYNPADPHNPMLDSKGRVWTTSKIRGREEPKWCNDPALGNKSADWFPLTGSGRQTSYYDPKTQKWQLIETCYSTHHLQFDNDADETLYFNELSGPIFGWLNTKLYDKTLAETKNEIKAEQTAVGWCGQVVDTNGDGKITRPWNTTVQQISGNELLYQGDTGGGAAPAPARGAAAPPAGGPPAGGGAGGGAAGGGRGAGRGGGRGGPAAPFDPKLDTMVRFNLYSVIPSPADDSVWGVSENPMPGMLIRLQRGNNPPESCKTQVFKIPEAGFDPRGIDIDTNGVVWTALAASSHLASFDVRKCKDLTGPQKTDGSQCAEGWTLYQTDGPKLKGTEIPADFHYYNWVDQQNIAGLGANTPFATGSNSDSVLALNTQTKEWINLRVPYPLGFYARGMDGRIDDPNGGWKGRGLWSNYGTHFVWHIEGGKGTKGKIVHFQIRPNALAR